MKNPFFSIIIPTYNRKDFLPIAVESVLNQSYTNYELIIVDDGSSDKTKAIIKKFYNKGMLSTKLINGKRHWVVREF